MALVQCVECGGKVSDRADECPHCGAPTSLSVEERVLRTFHPTMFAQDPKRLGWLTLLGVCTCGLGFVVMVPWWVELAYTRLEVTNRRVRLSKGFWTKTSSELLLDHVRNVTVRQGVTQRMVDAGDVGISSSGQSDIELQVVGLKHPEQLRELIDSYRSDD